MEIGTEAAQFLFWEYVNRNFFAMPSKISCRRKSLEFLFYCIWAHYLTRDVGICSRRGHTKDLKFCQDFSRHKKTAHNLHTNTVLDFFLFVDDLGATKLQMGWTVTIGRLQIVKM